MLNIDFVGNINVPSYIIGLLTPNGMKRDQLVQAHFHYR